MQYEQEKLKYTWNIFQNAGTEKWKEGGRKMEGRNKGMKKFYACLIAALVIVLAAACGKGTEENPEGEDTAGNGIIIQTTQSTPEMDKENEENQKPAVTGNETGGDNGNENGNKNENGAGNAGSDGQVVLSPEDLQEPEIAGQQVTEEIPSRDDAVNKLQIVFLGDSILDGYRNETGIAYLTGMYCDADVYNLAMGGTTAALSTYESAVYGEWTSRCLQGVVYAICGLVDPAIMEGYPAKAIFDSCDFSNTDYFVLEYGMNDFLSSIPLNDEETYYDAYTYVGALRVSVKKLQETFPDAKIVLCSPTYAHFWGKDGSYLGDGNMSSNGVANLVEYYRVCGNVAADMNTLFMNAYEGIGLNAYTADEYLEDGIHLSAKGRDEYAKKLSKIILECEETRNN